MSDTLWTDEQIEDEVNTDFRYLSSDDCESIIGLAKHIREDLAARITELELENERLRASADPDALLIVYGQGRTDEQEKQRRRITELEAQLANQYQRIERFVELVDQLEKKLAATTRWEPLPDGIIDQEYENTVWLSDNGETFRIRDRKTEYTLKFKTDKFRLCRLAGEETK